MKRLMAPAKIGTAGALGMDLGVLDTTPAQPRVADAADLIARFVIIVLFTLLAIRIGADFLETGKVTNLLLLAS